MVQCLARGHLDTLNAGDGTQTTNPRQPDELIEPRLAPDDSWRWVLMLQMENLPF